MRVQSALCGVLASRKATLVLSLFGGTTAVAQSVLLWIQYSQTRSKGIAACAVFALIFASLYVGYLRSLFTRRRTLRLWRCFSAKYLLIAHLLSSTWYFWMALMTYMAHNAGFSVFDTLFNGDSGSGTNGSRTIDMKDGTRLLCDVLFGVALLSLVVDAYVIVFHSRHLADAVHDDTIDASRSYASLKLASVLTCLIDVAMVVLSAVSFHIQRDGGTIVLIALLALSSAAQAAYMLQACGFVRLKQDWHASSQLLHLQHELIVSTTFLVNLMLILLNSFGLTVSDATATDSLGQSAVINLSIAAYVGIAFTTILLVTSITLQEEEAEGAAVPQMGVFTPYEAMPVMPVLDQSVTPVMPLW